jgi:hypothetical protein
MKVTVADWRAGFNKVKFDDLLREYAGLGLGDAKRATDRLLDHKPLEIEIADEGGDSEFSRRAIEIGAILEPLVPNPGEKIGTETAAVEYVSRVK